MFRAIEGAAANCAFTKVGAGILDLLSANFEDRNPLNSLRRVPLSHHRKATPHYRHYGRPRRRKPHPKTYLKLDSLRSRFESNGLKYRAFSKCNLYCIGSQSVYPGCTIFCAGPMCRAAEPCSLSLLKTGFTFSCLYRKFNKHKWNSRSLTLLRRLEKFFCLERFLLLKGAQPSLYSHIFSRNKLLYQYL